MHFEPSHMIEGLIGLFAPVAVVFALVMLCLCAAVVGALHAWRRRSGAHHERAGAQEDVGLRGFRWAEGDEP
ncbi:hypothetical protein [Streptomyces ficellus]|uniref:Uncharacterized protein n=1 Tax=Streptomyces ficellus TaxID=1977088 RepID=A0A6I6F642_9ACTN|nr:hypothetical protein [Streptomyces ficellus]QGV79130.1 hypothetical protein EIZ62_13365 [Streptomyces ficellus]